MSSDYGIKNNGEIEDMKFRFLDEDGGVTVESIKAAFRPPYPLKYYVNIVIFIIALTVFLLWNYGVIPGNKLGYFCNDPLFAHKFMGNTVNTTTLAIGLAFLFPLTYIIVEYIRIRHYGERIGLPHLITFYLFNKLFIFGIVLVGLVTEIAKTVVGEHRPHFFDTCRPDTNVNCTNGTYLFDFTCTNTDVPYLDIVDASRSFPSGHSSLSWFAAIYTAHVIHFRLPTGSSGIAFKTLLLLLNLTFAIVCSLTRITDRRHHWWDVLVGTIIGVIGAIYTIIVTKKQLQMLVKQMNIKDDKEMQMDYAMCS